MICTRAGGAYQDRAADCSGAIRLFSNQFRRVTKRRRNFGPTPAGPQGTGVRPYIKPLPNPGARPEERATFGENLGTWERTLNG